MNKRSAPIWYVALIHFLFTFLITMFLTVLFAVALGVLVPPVVKGEIVQPYGTLMMVVIWLAPFFFLWVGAFASAKFVNLRYQMGDKAQVVNYSSAFWAAFMALINFPSLSFTFSGLMVLLTVVAIMILFYVFSDKYII